MRLLGVDFGTKRVGLAVSDELGFGAYPLATVSRSRSLAHDLGEIVRYARKEEVGGVVFGLPLNMDGSRGPSAERAASFARALATVCPVPITFHDEFLTSFEAQEALIAAEVSRKKRKAVLDQMAAVQLLESYLRTQKEAAAKQVAGAATLLEENAFPS